ncbi:MAG: putative toxin-antitoxin system toxin component, PIN family [Opitutae bacterium]|nr:putative toxin-antitoxin system toxin component, PIN family [Opitutae bacterium]
MPTNRPRIVVDTNALVSRLLLPNSVPCRATQKAVEESILLISDATLAELADVLSRRKFDPYVTVKDRKQFIRLLGRISERVYCVRRIEACRDPKDDKFPELAVNGDADLIISGDKDLLDLNPFMGIDILSPSEFLKQS